jgi:predicted DCC family thiol-disulfide oxidoreductase YuxK
MKQSSGKSSSGRSEKGSRPAARLYYDRDCGFCRWTLAWILRWDRRGRLQPVPIERPEDLDSWHFARGGERWSAGKAFAPLLEELRGGRLLAPVARRLEWLLEPVYRWTADHRNLLSRVIPRGSKARADALVRARTDKRT